jgi:hypothetical protein
LQRIDELIDRSDAACATLMARWLYPIPVHIFHDGTDARFFRIFLTTLYRATAKVSVLTQLASSEIKRGCS